MANGALPAGYAWRDGAGYMKLSDNSGPYALGSSGGMAPIAGSCGYETVAASQTGQALGATGAVGDYIKSLTCVVTTSATSQVTLIDGATSIIVLPNNAGIGTHSIPLDMTSASGAWSITTAAGVAVIARGNFT